MVYRMPFIGEGFEIMDEGIKKMLRQIGYT
jgi:hypothetical protein